MVLWFRVFEPRVDDGAVVSLFLSHALKLISILLLICDLR